VSFDVASGTFMRLDIPFLNADDEFALYADVMFLLNPKLNEV